MDIIRKAKKFAKKEYKKNDKNHQWTHVKNVMKRAFVIAKEQKDVNYELLKLAIIFHDIDYHSEDTFKKNYKRHVDNSARVAKEFLEKMKYPLDKINLVQKIMLDHSTPHRKKRGEAQTIEGKIIYDADKSIFIKTKETYEKYFSLFYLDKQKALMERTI